MLGFAPYKHLSVYGGVTGSLLVDPPGLTRPSLRPGYQYLTTQADTTDASVSGWPGFVAGVGF